MLAKEPAPGRVKTRLCPPCSPVEAALVAAAALADTLDAAVASGADRVVLALDGRPGPWCPPGVVVIGQGTAAIAGQSLAAALTALADEHLRADAVVATEFSGFQLRDDMSDTLVVAISQSGTTTDTNRTSDLARARGAAVLAIVNRRNSDLVDKSDGVLYTSDGRDVEMAVPSTKAFYAQIAAGYLLGMRPTAR